MHFHAQKLSLAGFVRNTQEGELEVVAEGEEKQLLELLEKIKRGPGMARVEKVSANWLPATGEFEIFSIGH